MTAEQDRRDIIVSFRVTPAMAAHIDAAGRALRQPRQRADFCRAAALYAAKTRIPEAPKAIRRPGRRKPTRDIELLAKILAQLSKLNEFAKTASGNGQISAPPALVRLTVDISEIRDAVFAALSGGNRDEDQGGDLDHQG